MTDDLLPLPKSQELSYLHFSHVSFAVSDGRSLALIDPFFSGRFEWQGRTEQHLEPPTVPVEALRLVDAIFVSHEHGDHFDVDTLRTLLSISRALVYAPQTTIDAALAAGLDPERFRRVRSRMTANIGAMRVTAYPSVECDDQPEPISRVGFFVEHQGAGFYHQGDSHGPGRTWQEFRPRLDAMVIWPIYVDTYCRIMEPRSVIFHHMDRFTPGEFFCNADPRRELEYWQYRYPKTRFVVPQRNTWLNVKTHKPTRV